MRALLFTASLLLLPALVHADETQRVPFVMQVKSCRTVTKNECAGEQQAFKLEPGKRLYIWSRASGATPGAEIRHVWFHGDHKVWSKTLTLKKETWRTYSFKTMRANDVGAWHVEVQAADGAKLGEAAFTIER